MPESKQIRVFLEDFKHLENIRKAEGHTYLNETIPHILKKFESGKKLEKRLGKPTVAAEEPVEKKEAELKFIITRYPGQCTKCGEAVAAGSPAYWSPDVLMCIDCAVDTKSDKALMSRYLKARELDKILRMLKEESNRYADQINELKFGVRFNEIVVKFDTMLNLNEQYLKTLPGEKDPLVQELRKLCDETPAEMLELKASITSKLTPIKRKKKRQKTRQYA